MKCGLFQAVCLFFWAGCSPVLDLCAAAVLPAEQPFVIQFPTVAEQEDFSALACQGKDGVVSMEDNFSQAVAVQASLD